MARPRLAAPFFAMIESKFRNRVSIRIQSVAQFLARLGITANMVTLTGFLMNVVAAVFLGYGNLLVAGILMLIGGSLDFVDGSVARVRPIRDRSGALLDSVVDRYSEVAIFIAAAVFFHLRDNLLGLLLVMITMPGALLVSYVRARAEGLDIECKVGLMQRPERIFLLGVGLIVDPFLATRWQPLHLPLLVVFGILALTTQGTAFHRLLYAFRELKRHPISR